MVNGTEEHMSWKERPKHLWRDLIRLLANITSWPSWEPRWALARRERESEKEVKIYVEYNNRGEEELTERGGEMIILWHHWQYHKFCSRNLLLSIRFFFHKLILTSFALFIVFYSSDGMGKVNGLEEMRELIINEKVFMSERDESSWFKLIECISVQQL